MTKPNDKRRTSKSGLPARVEVHGGRFGKKVMVDGKRVSFTHLASCLEWTHAVELYDYCEAVREANRRSLPLPAKPWERPVDDPRRLVCRGMPYFDYAIEVVLPRWEATVGNPIKLHTFEHRRRFLFMHVLSAFRPHERNWARLPIDQIDFVEVEQWMLRRKAELVADQRRIQAGAPAPVLPGKAEWPRVREWATKQGLPGISAGVSKPSHTVLELYRAAHSKDPAAPSAPLLPSSEALDFAVWVAKEVFNEAVKDARILGVAVNPPAALKTGWYGRDTGIVRRKTNKRKPAEPDEIRRIAARLHPAHRLPLWLGVGSGC